MSTENNEEKKDKKKSGGAAGWIVALALLFGVGGGIGLGGGAGFGGLLGNGNGNGESNPAGSSEMTSQAAPDTSAAMTTVSDLTITPVETTTGEESTESQAPVQIVIRIKGKEVTLDQEVLAAEDLKAAVQDKYRDGMEVRLEGAYADSELYRQVSDMLKALSITYVEAAEK